MQTPSGRHGAWSACARLACCALLGLSVALAAGPARAEETPRPRAASGDAVIQALERAPLGVVGSVSERRPVDGERAWRATLVVERALVGDMEAGAELGFVWEELARARAPRFAPGERVLLALQPLRASTLWRRRLPNAELTKLWRVAQRDQAFVRAPSLGAVEGLFHYLQLPEQERRGAAGADRLARLVAAAEVPVAVSAATALGRATDLEPPAARRVVKALERPEPEVREALQAVIARHRPEAVVAALEARLVAEEPAPPAVVEALGRAAGALGMAQAAPLLEDPDPARRAAAARHAPEAARPRLARLAAKDDAPEVRAAALARLLVLGGEDALEPALAALADPDVQVRAAAARGIAGIGPKAIPSLEEVAARGPEAGRGVVLALSLMRTRESRSALEELAASHPDEGVRRLAGVALGRLPGHDHPH